MTALIIAKAPSKHYFYTVWKKLPNSWREYLTESAVNQIKRDPSGRFKAKLTGIYSATCDGDKKLYSSALSAWALRSIGIKEIRLSLDENNQAFMEKLLYVLPLEDNKTIERPNQRERIMVELSQESHQISFVNHPLVSNQERIEIILENKWFPSAIQKAYERLSLPERLSILAKLEINQQS